ncbi:MAG: triose-phosphate isomerase [Promethearchaeota archaeon]
MSEAELRGIVEDIVRDVVDKEIEAQKEQLTNSLATRHDNPSETEEVEIIIAANWKMNKNVQEMETFLKKFKSLYTPSPKIRVLICPPSYLLLLTSQQLIGTQIYLGAQNMHYESQGAFTGEISPTMLLDAGCQYVILGHSERRHIFGEDDKLINKKVNAALKNGINPILCIGETLEQRKEGSTFRIVKNQLLGGLQEIGIEKVSNVVVAYEPVWSIGTGITATPEQAQKVHEYIREILTTVYNHQVAQKLRILYGGSVKPENARALITQPDVDGSLIGGASLDPVKFNDIIDVSQ